MQSYDQQQTIVMLTYYIRIAILFDTYYLVSMRLQEFNTLDNLEKATVLTDHGVLIGKRALLFYLIFLFQIDGFYVEVLYSEKSKKVHSLKAFENTELLNPYLSRIDISGIQAL